MGTQGRGHGIPQRREQPSRRTRFLRLLRRILAVVAGETVDDIAEAVAERISRQGYLLQRDRQFVFVIEEPVLRFRP